MGRQMAKIIAFLLLFSSLVFAQELNCKVVVNYESLSVETRDLLRDFAAEIESYINTTAYTDNWQYRKIDCNMNVFFSSGGGGNYSAQVIVSAQRPIYKSIKNSLLLTISDNAWTFAYERGQSFYHNPGAYDPITGFLDYYAYTILGFYMESWEQGAGSPFMTKAFDIINLGARSSYANGWEKNSNSYSRRGLAEDFLNDKYSPFREAYYNYYYGIDIFAQAPEEGRAYIISFVNTLDQMRQKVDVRGVLIKVFFDAKYGELIEYLRDNPDKSVFEKLKKIDPGHTSKYDAVI
jgi:hypothetical protein